MLVDRNTLPRQVVYFVKENKPDLVLLAENFQAGFLAPEQENRGTKIGEGINALVGIREEDKTTPIYMVSGSPQYREKAIQSGANGYFRIPFQIENYIEFLRSITQL